jgi:hypothetical protein
VQQHAGDCLRGQSSSAGVVKVPHSTRFDADKVKQQLGISSVHGMNTYEMKQLSQRKVTQGEAAAYFDAVFNNTSLSIADQEDNIIQFYRNVAAQASHPQAVKPNRMDAP